MKSRLNIKLVLTAAALLVAAAVAIVFLQTRGFQLILENSRTGEQYASFPIENGERFYIEFVHSVNKTPVRDIYEIRNNTEIYVVETDYFGFGAGVQTQLGPGEVLTYGSDGSMQIKNIDKLLPSLIYIVGTISDHTLGFKGQELSLRELCGKNSSVHFVIKPK